ncbi:MAG TPA: ribosome-binding factor A [Patescibacteria group bacterium]
MNITRHQQLLSLIKRVTSAILRELDHEHLHSAVITNVILSNDGREARIWVDAPAATITLLNTKYRGEIQHLFMKQYARKVVPRLTFEKDTGEIDRLEVLLSEEPLQDEPQSDL